MTALLLLWACEGTALPPPAPPQTELVATVAAMQVDEGQPVALTVQARQAEGWSMQVPPPLAEGLEARLVAQEGPVQQGERQVLTWRYELSGPPGSYVLTPGTATATGPGGETRPVQAPPIFVDIGVQGPSSPVADFQAPPPPQGQPWGLYAALAAGGLALALGGAALWARAHRRPLPPPPPEPVHVVARRQWREIRERGLLDHPQAVALSHVLRGYLEATTGWPATMRTGPEILRWMEADAVAGAATRLRAARILDATDRLKFAREGGGEAFFAALDDDFDAVIEATRPVEPAAAGPAPPVEGP